MIFLHQFRFQFSYQEIQGTVEQFPIWLAIAATAQKRKGQTHNNVTIDFRASLIYPAQLCTEKADVEKYTDILHIGNKHWTADHNKGTQDVFMMFFNSLLKAEMHFLRGPEVFALHFSSLSLHNLVEMHYWILDPLP